MIFNWFSFYSPCRLRNETLWQFFCEESHVFLFLCVEVDGYDETVETQDLSEDKDQDHAHVQSGNDQRYI